MPWSYPHPGGNGEALMPLVSATHRASPIPWLVRSPSRNLPANQTSPFERSAFSMGRASKDAPVFATLWVLLPARCRVRDPGELTMRANLYLFRRVSRLDCGAALAAARREGLRLALRHGAGEDLETLAPGQDSVHK